MIEDIHSRSRLAGYEPELLFGSKILIVGAGALGQNLALDLALAGVGEIALVDFDLFETHNATRSPLYPTTEEVERWGKEKAKVVAQKLLPLMTAREPIIRYAVMPIQALGDLPIIHAHLVFAAVDNQEARAYLAERCRVVGRPLIEGGFRAEKLNVSFFGPDADEPCYRCASPERIGAFSCTRYALQVEAQQAIPAIQNTAAVLAGLQAEIGIRWLHGERRWRNKHINVDIHTMIMETFNFERSSECPGIHWQSADFPLQVGKIQGDDPLAYLLRAIEEIGPAQIRFPENFVVRHICTQCERLTDAFVPEWRWQANPLCTECGGPFELTKKDALPESRTYVLTDEDDDEITNLPCKQSGLSSGTLCEIWPESNQETLGERYIFQMQGTIDELMEKVSATYVH